MTTNELLRQQDELQAEASTVNEDLGLDEALGRLGDPVRVGSAALGLMVKRDLDITVVCPRLGGAEREAVVAVGARLALHERVWQVRFRNDTGAWNTDPGYPDGLYLGVGYRSPQGRRWSLDIWFVDEPERQPDLAHVRTLPERLTAETREAILRIKEAWAERPEYGRSVRSWDVYRSVLDDGVRTVAEFDGWRSARSSTSSE
ncbi:hypothetical protein OG500_03895 [Kitasatospora sp. NBC_01250]|uniref:hypothetical protein n=1 Tax=unclassified Kitasatospora TaxID=2633591 RepID=UPI002E15F9C2|nr:MULTISPECIES: hypothetical protein [unclassified Kitasatospora]WSJ65292.1 hypothetical protein OG294_03825 [Kitasatospora sp. NBC_01302]